MSGNNFGSKHLRQMNTATDQTVPAASIYDYELEKITQLMNTIQEKWSKKEISDENVKAMQLETINRFADLGFRVQIGVDKDSGLFTFDIVGRTESHEFDIERKIWEVQKNNKKKKFIKEL